MMMGLIPWLLMLVVCGHASARKIVSCSNEKEIVFLLDSSRSLGSDNFQKVLNFTRLMVNRYDISTNKTRVAAISFSTVARLEFGLNQYHSAKELRRAVEAIPYMDGLETNTHLAFRKALDRVFSPNPSENMTQAIICVTDGQPTNPYALKDVVDEARKRNILLFAVGVGSEVEEGLEQIATNSTSDFIYHAANFDQGLINIIRNFSQHACFDDDDVEVCRAKPMDVVFVLDRSSSVGEVNFTRLINFTSEVAGVMDIRPEAAQIAAVTYARDVTIEFTLAQHLNKTQVLNGLGNIRYSTTNAAYTATDEALELVRHAVLNPQNGARNDNSTGKVVIVVTDGLSQERVRTRKMAAALKGDGVVIFAIGVGMELKEELQAIATNSTDGSQEFFFEITDYQALANIKHIVARTACQV
ncbi:matrilin-1-like [Babylonia areolata]|uniref:matrilin-1-like n=1 Tax=Babylonia areolata TaxID=304850 RepID=UPI003FD05231